MSVPWKGRAIPGALMAEDFEEAARRLGCEPAAIRAVWEVEAGGRHFLPDGSVIRRFEPHHFPRQHWPVIGYAVKAGEAPWRASLRLSSEAMFQRAVALDKPAACRAASWGAPQIMGFNAAAAGFDSPVEMVRHMAEGAPQQLGAFVQLVEGWGLASAIRARDWLAFARRYNGSGKPESYARSMEAAYRRHSGARSPVVLRVGDRGPAVAELQRALGIRDDGAFGPQTLAAVRAFQAERGLVVDGIVGARTWGALAERSPDPPAQPATVIETATAAVERLTGWRATMSANVKQKITRPLTDLHDKVKGLLWGGLAGSAVVAAIPFGDARLIELIQQAITLFFPVWAPLLVPMVGPLVGVLFAFIGGYVRAERR